jgi:uncharacterized membrane protein
MNLTMTGTAAIATLAVAGAAIAQPTYTVIDLGTLGGPASAAFSVNSLGRAVGVSPLADANWRGLASGAGPTEQINPLAGDSQCWGFGISPSGALIAESFNMGDTIVHGILASGGTTTSLGPMSPRGINTFGTIVGHQLVQDPTLGPLHTPVTWQAGTITALPTLGGTFGFAAAINDQDWIAGWTMPAGDAAYRATLWINNVPSDLGTLGGNASQAYAISNSRAVAGWGRTVAGAMHAMHLSLSATGTVAIRTDLGTLDGSSSVAYGVNSFSWVVGTSGGRAFVWRAGGPLVDLNSTLSPGSGWVLEQAWAISDSGYIAGAGTKDGWSRGFILGPFCYANCDGSTSTPALTANDFTCFINKYAASDPYANCDGSTGTPALTANDFLCFINKYAAGCS